MQAVAFLAVAGGEGIFVPVRRIAEELGISPPFLAKVLHVLTERGLLRSKRGPGGGVALDRPPNCITLKEIVLIIDGPELFEECVLGLPACGERRPCPLHEDFGLARTGLATAFEDITVAALAESAPENFFNPTYPGST